MGALLGLTFACGLLFAWSVCHRESGPAGSSASAGVAWLHDPRRRRQLRRTCGSVIVCAVAGLVLTQLLVVGVLAGGLGAGVPTVLARRQARRVHRLRQAAWPDVVDSLVSAVRAGLSLPEAMCAVAVRGPEPLRAPFAEFAADFRATGRFEDCLRRLRDRLADPVADRISEAMLAARDVGGTDLGRMLRTLSDFLRQDLRLRGEAQARRSWTINGARLAVAAPWVVLVLLSTRPGTVEAYRTSTGMVLLVVAAIVSTIAYWVMTVVGRLPQERRVLL